jgi:branched-chain amino acid transport system ATP-binding protein
VLYGGEDVTRRSAHWRARRGIATSYQIPRPFLGMTVFENLLVAATFAGGERGRPAQERAAEALEITHLAAHANDDAASLRLLDRKRLEVARALAAEPRLLLLDEIAGGLTEQEVPELVEIVRGVSAGGVTIVWIEHVVHALTALATRMLCLSYGTVLAEGTPDEVLADPGVRAVYLGLDPEAA